MFSNLFSAIQGEPPPEEPSNVDDQKNNGSQKRQTTMSLFDVASSVVTSVRDGADEIMSSIKETSWSSEFANFGKAVQDETQQALKNLEAIPEKAEEMLPRMTSVGTRFHRLVGGAKDLFNQTVGNPGSPDEGLNGGTKTQISNTKYRRFESEIMAMQQDVQTYCSDPEDAEDFEKWKQDFSLEEKEQDIEKLKMENPVVAELHNRLVPLVLQNSSFWMRYFYKFDKLQQKHDQRQQLAERAMKMHEEEQELHWDEEAIITGDQKDKGQSKDQKSETQEEESDRNIVDPPVSQPPETSNQTTEKAISEEEEEIDEDWGSWE